MNDKKIINNNKETIIQKSNFVLIKKSNVIIQILQNKFYYIQQYIKEFKKLI